jgi:hypothetical protein
VGSGGGDTRLLALAAAYVEARSSPEHVCETFGHR